MDRESEKSISDDSDYDEDAHSDFVPDFASNSEPLLINQNRFDDLCKSLKLSKEKSEMLGSKLKSWNLLEPNTHLTTVRHRSDKFKKYFATEEGLTYCEDVNLLFNEFGTDHLASDWRLFIDAAVKSLKVVLLHNGNDLPSVPIAYSTTMKESYDNVKLILEKIQYNRYQWLICSDLKMDGILLGHQPGNTKFPCFFCLFDAQHRELHYKDTQWPMRTDFSIGTHNVQKPALVSREKILMPSLHLKLGLIKQFIKTLVKRNEKAYECLKSIFSKKSESKIKEGIFDGQEIRRLRKNKTFPKVLKNEERRAYNAFCDVCDNVLGNKKVTNYKKIVKEMLHSYKDIGCLMSVKLHYFESHLDLFSSNMTDYSDEHGERMHKDLKFIETRFAGKSDASALGEYCWSLTRSKDEIDNRQERLKHNWFNI